MIEGYVDAASLAVYGVQYQVESRGWRGRTISHLEVWIPPPVALCFRESDGGTPSVVCPFSPLLVSFSLLLLFRLSLRTDVASRV